MTDNQQAAREWLPIESAPKDGTRIMVANDGGVWVAEYRPVYQSGYRPENPWASEMLNHHHISPGLKSHVPTHWQPLPAPPRPTQERTGD